MSVGSGTAAPTAGTRAVRLERGDDGRREVAVHDGPSLRPGHVLTGPALVDGSDTTIWIPDGCTAQVDEKGTLNVETTA